MGEVQGMWSNYCQYEVIGLNCTWKIKRKIADALLIKEHSPDLSEQGQSMPLKLLIKLASFHL